MRHLRSLLVLVTLLGSLFFASGCDLVLEVLDEQLSQLAEEEELGENQASGQEEVEQIRIEDLLRTEKFRKGALEHILEGELNARGQAVGFHYDGLDSKRGEIIQGTKTRPNDQGVFEAEVAVDGVKKESNRGRSSFFPDEWTAQEVIDRINEAYENSEFITGNTYEGLSDNGVLIRMYLDKNDKIISAFPVY